MDAKVSLAIYAKIQKIYNDPGAGKFLAFPHLNIYSFSPNTLSPLLKSDATDAIVSLEKTAEFSRMINTPVVGTFFPEPGHDTYLWDIYEDILDTAEIAESNSSEDEEKTYKKACEVLFATDEYGLKTNTQTYQRYCDFKDRYYVLTEELINLSSSSASDIELQKKQHEIDNLKIEWASQGCRMDIEKNLAIVKNFEASCPSIVWKELSAAYNKDIALQKSLSNSQFAPTYLFPFDVLKEDWSKIIIGQEEIASLCNNASAELKSRYPFAEAEDDIQSISFEYRSVLVERPWLNENVFKSKLWRFPLSKQISYGPGSFKGRFPAYVCALLLSRNFTVTYQSGRTENSLGEGETTNNDTVSVLSYICKFFPRCPDEDKNAKWVKEEKKAFLDVQQVSGGTINAVADGNEIGNGQVLIGQMIEFSALAKPGFILASWSINGVKHPNRDYTYKCVMPKEGLKVVPFWEQSATNEGIEAVVNGTTLVSLSGAPLHLDMNKYGNLHNVTTIAANAFCNSPNLCSIVIGNMVTSIGENAFSACQKLESITIPKNTQFIAKNAFSRDNILNDPIINVDPENETYTTLNGLLEEKARITKIKSIHCKCHTVLFYDKKMPEYCPKCGAQLSLNNAVVEDIRIPDSRIPFKIMRDEAIYTYTKFVSRKKFVSRDFIQAVNDGELELTPVYVPYWKWNVQANGQFKIIYSTSQNTGEKDADGKDIVKQTKHEKNAEASCPEKIVWAPSSRVIDSKVVELGNRVSEAFSFEGCPESTVFELYSRNMKESQQDVHNSVIADLESKASRCEQGEILVRVAEKKVDFVKESCSLVMNPVWKGTMVYKDTEYPFYIDGYTGNVQTMKKMPKNWKLIGIIAGSIAEVIAIIVLLCIF